MSNGVRGRSVSAPVTKIELRELNKYRDKRICKEDLEIFVEKYKKESKIPCLLRKELPPEIRTIEHIANGSSHSLTKRTPISHDEKEILSNMIAMNKEYRSKISNHALRLRDVIIDRMIAFFGLEKEIPFQYLSFEDYL